MSEMFRLAFKAGIPIISVSTDDMVNLEAVLQHLSGCSSSQHNDTLSAMSMYKPDLALYSTNPKILTVANYEMLSNKGKSLVVVNMEPSDLSLDAGVLYPTKELILAATKDYAVAGIESLLSGLSLKSIESLLTLTSVKFGNLSHGSIVAMRAMLGKPIQGLYPIDTKTEFYSPHPPLAKWVAESKAYFLSTNVKPTLRPRGMLLNGMPGSGKTAASKYIANQWGVPLYRLDIGTSMSKYVGSSEGRLMQILDQVEQNSPVVLLLDEVEKVFVHDADGGVLTRMMSQLLWWLAEHRSRVFTVMTTNNKDSIPPELYRRGRVDTVMELPRLTLQQAKELAGLYMSSLLAPAKPTLLQLAALDLHVSPDVKHTPADVVGYVEFVVKSNGWVAT